MKVQVPSDAYIAGLGESQKTDNVLSFRYGFLAGIGHAKNQLESAICQICGAMSDDIVTDSEKPQEPPSPTKRPFLNDDEIDEEAESYSNSGRVEKICFCVGARWARDKYEARDAQGVPNVEPKWQPVVGQLVAAWGHNYYKEDNLETVVGIYQAQKSHDGYHIIKGFNDENDFYRSYVAALETLDEIGKPPSYFQERGRCTV